MKFVLVGEREYTQYFTCLRRNSKNQLVGNLNCSKKRKNLSIRKWTNVDKKQKFQAKKKYTNYKNQNKKNKNRGQQKKLVPSEKTIIQNQKMIPNRKIAQSKVIPEVPSQITNPMSLTNDQDLSNQNIPPSRNRTASGEALVKEKINELFKNEKYITSYSKYLKQLFDKLEVPSKFKRKLKKFPRRKTRVNGPFNTYQMDLVEYQSLKHYNNGYKYILTIIDCFSRYGFAYPLKSKDANNTAKQILVFLESLETVPRFIYSDAGKEFENSKVQAIFKSRGILHFVLKNGPKASIVERFNKTLKSSIEMYFSENNTKRWYGKTIDFIVDNYNELKSRSIGMAPVEVNRKNYMKVYKKLYPKSSSKRLCRLKKGDIVRIALKSDLFKKGYKQQFSDELYTILKSISSGNVCYYIIKNKQGEKIKKYYQELSLVGHVNNNNTIGNK